MYKYMTVKMSDNVVWKVPVDLIARNRAQYYAYEFNDDIEQSLKEDTLPLFEVDSYEIEDWATGNMDWADVKDECLLLVNNVELNSSVDYQDGWLNGEKGFIE